MAGLATICEAAMITVLQLDVHMLVLPPSPMIPDYMLKRVCRDSEYLYGFAIRNIETSRAYDQWLNRKADYLHAIEIGWRR